MTRPRTAALIIFALALVVSLALACSREDAPPDAAETSTSTPPAISQDDDESPTPPAISQDDDESPTPPAISQDAAESPTPPAISQDNAESSTPPAISQDDDVTPFVNVAPSALLDGYEVVNYRPSAVAFDYDRDGDHDLYITSNRGSDNFLYANLGDGTFANVSREAGAALTDQNSSGAVACDFDNDGFQDLYVGARGIIGDGLDFRSAAGDGAAARGLRRAIGDRLLRNAGDGTFSDVTESAFGSAVNLRSAASVACADVDGDGLLDIYVANAVDEDWFIFDQPSHPGHYNRLYRNNGDMTFAEISESAGVAGGQIRLLDADGAPVLFQDPDTGAEYEGYDPTILDADGNRVADPSGRTHAALFFDHDDDGDPDLWAANDGHRIYVFRNDTENGEIRFTDVAEDMGVDKSGNWMGFAIGDYDGDADLDLFIPNVGPHLRRFAPQTEPGGDCRYTERFEWGTCLHYLLRNDGAGAFTDAAENTEVVPSPLMPPRALDKRRLHPDWDIPAGLGAYDFGYGTAFFDYDNDGDQDLYWLGSEGPPGRSSYPAAGRMLRGDGRGGFEDITVRARLLDILDVDYSVLDANDPDFNPDRQRISTRFHLNGKALATADLNGDGFPDLIGTNSSGPIWDDLAQEFTPALGPVFVWINGGGGNNWITLRLQGAMGANGTGSNADAIGARAYLTAGGKTQVQEVHAGSSYLSMHGIELEFGLGAAETVDEIAVKWPSGRTQTLTNVAANQTLLILEPES